MSLDCLVEVFHEEQCACLDRVFFLTQYAHHQYVYESDFEIGLMC